MTPLRTELAETLYYALQNRVAGRRPPDFIVGDLTVGGAYLRRWYLTPWRNWQQALRERARKRPTWRNRAAARLGGLLPNLYLHHFLRDDDDRALHDHPSWAISFILAGGYVEHTIAGGGIHHRRYHGPGALRFLPSRLAHRIELVGESARRPLTAGCWTLFLFGPTVREWGFHCPQRGWVHWREFTAPGAPGEIGRGCD